MSRSNTRIVLGIREPRVGYNPAVPEKLYGIGDAGWQVKQALDIGVMGFVFNTVETKEQAEAAVKSMRYPPWKAFPNTHKGPEGWRS